MGAPLYRVGPNDTFLELDYDSLLRQTWNMTMSQHGEDQYSRDLLTYYVMGVGGMALCCLGFVGNVLSLIVLAQRSMRTSTYSYLSALAVCDSLVLLFTVILLIKDINKPERGRQQWAWDEGIYPYLFPYIHPAAFTFQVTSIWLTLSFTVDRYIMICHPFKAEPFCTVSRARKVIMMLYITGILFNVPKFFEYETVTIHLPLQNITKIGWDLTDFGRSHIFRELCHSWFYIVFVCGVPFLSLAVLNGCLMHAVHVSRVRGKEINAAEKKRNDTTIMLTSVVVVFFICQTPALVSRTIWAFEHDPKAFQRLPLYTLNEIGNFLMIMNSSINIVPYYFFGRRFRRNFWRIFCRCLLGYKKFSKLSRTLSLTVFDQRRPSTANNSLCIEKLGSEGPYPNHQMESPSSKLMVHTRGSIRNLSTDSSLADSSYQELINGSCRNTKTDKVCVLLVTKPGQTGKVSNENVV